MYIGEKTLDETFIPLKFSSYSLVLLVALLTINSYHTNFSSNKFYHSFFFLLLFDMTNTNFSLQCPRLTKNNYEIRCFHVKAWLGFQDVWETVGKKSFEKLIKGVTLTSAQKEVVQKAQRNNQQALTIIHQYLDDTTFEIVDNVATAKQVW